MRHCYAKTGMSKPDRSDVVYLTDEQVAFMILQGVTPHFLDHCTKLKQPCNVPGCDGEGFVYYRREDIPWLEET